MTARQVQLSGRDTELDALAVAPTDGWNAMFIDGEWTAGRGDEHVPITSPATREEVGAVPSALKEDVDDAYEAAETAREAWAGRPPQTRADVVRGRRRSPRRGVSSRVSTARTPCRSTAVSMVVSHRPVTRRAV